MVKTARCTWRGEEPPYVCDHDLELNQWGSTSGVLSTTRMAEAMSGPLNAKGFKIAAPTNCYAFMQASRMVNDHLCSCFRITRRKQPGAQRCVVA